MIHKLVLLEGLPGTGKTTLSEHILKLLTGRGIQADLLLEGHENNPSNFYHVAGIPKSAFADSVLDIPVIATTKRYVYVNLGDCTEDDAAQIRHYDIGDEFNPYISAQEYARCTLARWQYWVDKNLHIPIRILDSAFMQCPMNEMIFRGASDPEVEAYIRAIAEIIKPLQPVCIYLRRESAEISIAFAKAVKGARWAKGIERLADMGCADLFERRFALENMLVSSVPHIVCSIHDDDWSDAEIKIRELFE